MFKLRTGPGIIQRLFPFTEGKPLVGSQITFAIRTIKAALNGKGPPQEKPDRSA